jgi:hypothetical protein
MAALLPFNENIYIGYNENEVINLFNDQRNNNIEDHDILETCFTIYVFTLCSLTVAYIWIYFII